MTVRANTVEPNKIIIGWREWLALPDLGIQAIKAKVDTGARTSALHTFGLETFEESGILKLKFGIHPLQKRKDIEIRCVTDVVDRRRVTSSGGQSERRYVIRTTVAMGEIEVADRIDADRPQVDALSHAAGACRNQQSAAGGSR